MNTVKVIIALFVVGLLYPTSASAAPATYAITPASGTFAVGSSIRANLILQAANQGVNAGEGTLIFPADYLTATSVSKGSVFSFWQTSPSIGNGSIHFVAGRTGAFTGQGMVLTVSFKAKKEGKVTLSLQNGNILAADGDGSSVYGGASSATWTIGPAPENKSLPPLPVISSPTNPDQTAWYNNTEHAFQWGTPNNADEVAYIIDDKANTEPSNPIPLIGEFTTKDIPEGTYYVHARFKNSNGWGQTAHFRIQKDVTPPEKLTIGLADGNSTVQKRPRVQLSAQDTLSGIGLQQIKIDDRALIEVSPDQEGYADLPRQDVGNHTATYLVTDKAGNKAEIQAEYRIITGALSSVSEMKENAWCIPIIILLLILLILLLMYILRLKRKVRELERAMNEVHNFIPSHIYNDWLAYKAATTPEERLEILARVKPNDPEEK